MVEAITYSSTSHGEESSDITIKFKSTKAVLEKSFLPYQEGKKCEY